MLQTGILTHRVIKDDNIDASYRQVKEVGFDCLDFSFDKSLSLGDIWAGEVNDVLDRPMEEIWEDFKPHMDAITKYGLRVGQTHAPFPCKMWDKDELNEKLFRVIVNTMELSYRMGSRYIVIHPTTLPDECGRKAEYDFNIEMYKSFIPAAKKFHQIICLENMFECVNGHLTEASCSDFAETAAMIDELNEFAGEELFGFCFDVGHANVLGKNMYRSVMTLGKRIKVLHIHDNDGVSDLHNMPFTFMRGANGLSTDWDGFLKGLKDIGYKGVLNFEVARCMDGFPVELHPSVLKLLADIGKYFAKRIEE